MHSLRLFWWILGAFFAAVVATTLPLIVIGFPSIQAHSTTVVATLIGLTVVIGGTLSWVCATLISQPLERISRIARRYSRGELTARLYPSRVYEIETVADSLNSMAASLSGQVDKITLQRNELEIVLASMLEGVIAIDPNERVFRINHSALQLLDIAIDEPVGRTLQEVVRNSELHTFVRSAIDRGVYGTCELVFPGQPERTIEITASELKMADGISSGLLLVFHDLTNLRHLETVRKDFVANVSHELRTPITSIKGFVETLLDGAMQEPADSERFLKIIAHHVDRLDSIFDDLLLLARIELNEESVHVELTRHAIIDSLTGAVAACAAKSTEKNIHVSVDCSRTLEAEIVPGLLEQAIINLLDNAIKYTQKGGAVLVSAQKLDNGRVKISVQDDGVGIEARHLDRIFERFYRVDEARSRKLGGTGLGLAIVKHIASVHGGTASVRSKVGEGSTFSIEF